VSRPLDAVLAPPDQRPTYLAAGLTGLLEPHPPVAVTEDAFRCEGWTARWAAGDQLELDGSGEMLDGLRALCAAAWSAEKVTPEMVQSALSRLQG
jgi:glycerol 3-phosphatase-2